MDINLTPGTYVLAISGGVDSMVLLDLAAKRQTVRGFRFVVAHFEHGIREDSEEDMHLVREVASKHGMPFVFDQGRLGKGASEAKARDARYKFLHRVMQISAADAIVTAHHEDDLIETAILNIMRGTGPRGLHSLKSTDTIIRPLLSYSKREILAYAGANKIAWHEDSTNEDESYKRNYIRRQIIPKLSVKDRQEFVRSLNKAEYANQQIDQLLPDVSGTNLSKTMFVKMPHDVACEIAVNWLKEHKVTDISKQKVERLVVAAKTLKTGKQITIDKHTVVRLENNNLQLVRQ